MKRAAIGLIGLALTASCSTVQVNGEAGLRPEKVGRIQKHCQELRGQVVKLRARFMGWNCPPECGAPPKTRSDVCLIDDTGCIYAYGTGGFDPVLDKGKEFLITAKVVWEGGKCYLKVLDSDEVR
jgi:hypothetical protein